MDIKYPYIPEGRKIEYVDLNNEFMFSAKENLDHEGCVKQPTSAVVVKSGKIIGKGSNASVSVEVCPRWGSPTGTNYEPCKEVCHQVGHAEVTSIEDAKRNGCDTKDADLYLYGHWWCCKPCWDVMTMAGIRNVYLLVGSWNLFNPEINTEMQEWGKPQDKA